MNSPLLHSKLSKNNLAAVKGTCLYEQLVKRESLLSGTKPSTPAAT